MIVRFHIDQIERGQYEYRVSYEGEDLYADSGLGRDRKSTRLNSSHIQKSRMPSSA